MDHDKYADHVYIGGQTNDSHFDASASRDCDYLFAFFSKYDTSTMQKVYIKRLEGYVYDQIMNMNRMYVTTSITLEDFAACQGSGAGCAKSPATYFWASIQYAEASDIVNLKEASSVIKVRASDGVIEKAFNFNFKASRIMKHLNDRTFFLETQESFWVEEEISWTAYMLDWTATTKHKIQQTDSDYFLGATALVVIDNHVLIGGSIYSTKINKPLLTELNPTNMAILNTWSLPLIDNSSFGIDLLEYLSERETVFGLLIARSSDRLLKNTVNRMYVMIYSLAEDFSSCGNNARVQTFSVTLTADFSALVYLETLITRYIVASKSFSVYFL